MPRKPVSAEVRAKHADFLRKNKPALKHGDHNSPEYILWCNIKARCYNVNHHKYPMYGAVGIRIFEEWKDNYQLFLDYIGRRPTPKHSLDRIDGSKSYEPGNVRWATKCEQAENRPNFVNMIEHNGIKQTLSKWADEFDVSRWTIRYRLKQGYSMQEIQDAYAGKVSRLRLGVRTSESIISVD